ncbi:bifunctional UDP-N-acetylglucosamine diphosphorylase/glucosamine-1-phosphate N-acetyltransferase GlmU [Streptomonospora nanhaiensis]|uniref:Bifunctional protein GlmU n=1 Tax=Streptomonospora nanhaiensis TaxID=1323731 RepID=A0A853BND5_9ACTN|nr:bifunctional UDP-N-acetylglucosamine diphosphorylase/glucosamine-1-phosphate N-acetyltransferase GlmU [Streptomonospora nanhaiensis]MBV2362019.1 bifunctional UDP-N-acetylglucosamine diphosphorylase/glucosamine-1-phosphate N-acetyltransferase GlmU [Streptomonospora nanhaiensis]MBX9386748.1 bifunctional UDP-N-acetylglucosamine diphosphorylase/glucosamine-1-phosphate N-acetyltransferase GlmU [Streptomonospora nanhaiensis]NYI96157.1 bifunctional UDP-N-acetylglucosamine pyrophosphorylase/glucosami
MSVSRPAAVIVLAAGEGTRMKSRLPKVLHEICGRSMLGHVLAAAGELDPERTVVVVGHAREQVVQHLKDTAPAVGTAVQDEQNGTGHAVRMAVEALAAEGVALSGTVVLAYGDTPLLRGRTLADLVEAHESAGNAVTVLSARVPDPAGYGRVVRDPSGAFTAIVEHADATPEQRALDEINSGMYAFDGALLTSVVQRLSTDNAKGEEYITDAVAILRGDGHRVGAALAREWTEIQGVNDRVQLAEARRLLNDRLLTEHMRAGVTVVDPATTWVDAEVSIGRDTVVEPQTQLRGRTVIGEGALVGPCTQLTDTRVGDDAKVRHVVADSAEIAAGANVGPYAYLRPGASIGPRAKIGTFVEVKNSQIGEGSKVPHLTYVGDATIGVGANIGASSVFVNYDGVDKHRTTVGDHARTGSDNTFVAPVHIGDGAYTGAGTVVREDVPPGALAVSAGSQRNIEGWVRRKRPGTPAAEAAERAENTAERRGEDS